MTDDKSRKAFDYPMSLRAAAYRCKELSKCASDEAIRVIAKNLDLAMEDAETVDFVRQALMASCVDIRASYTQAALRYRDEQEKQA